MAKIEKSSQFIGAGAFVQLLGFILLWFFPFGTAVGLLLLVKGSMMAVRRVCSQCRNDVNKGSKICPVCGESFN